MRIISLKENDLRIRCRVVIQKRPIYHTRILAEQLNLDDAASELLVFKLKKPGDYSFLYYKKDKQLVIDKAKGDHTVISGPSYNAARNISIGDKAYKMTGKATQLYIHAGTILSFGKYKGSVARDIPRWYLKWLNTKTEHKVDPELLKE